MSNLKELLDFTAHKHFSSSTTETYLPTQIGSTIEIIQADCDISALDVVLVGCGEFRGQDGQFAYSDGPDKIRHAFYQLHDWHTSIKIGDIGNIIQGQTLKDTKAALRTVLAELYALGKRVVILGGSHDLTLQQYEVFKQQEEIVDFSVIDMLADVNETSGERYDNYLLNALTSTPNFVRHFNLIGFQSYFVNPKLIETLDKLHFDCIRVGKVKEDIEQVEPMLRNTHFLSIDINAARHSDAPCNKTASPNGFYGDEMCKLTRFAGMGNRMHSLGIYGYLPENDVESLSAKLIAQMLWYYVDGLQFARTEASLDDKDQFFEYHITFTDNNTSFLKSRKTNRWWMKLPNNDCIPCSHKDYISACNNEIPERWIRQVERSV